MVTRVGRWLALGFCLSFLTQSPPVAAADDDILFSAELSANEQSAPTPSPATGHIDIWLERATLKITWQIEFRDLSSPVVSLGLYGPESPGANAQLNVLLAGPELRSPSTGSAFLSDAHFQNLITTKMYVNLITSKFQLGELRGQLRRQLQTRADFPNR